MEIMKKMMKVKKKKTIKKKIRQIKYYLALFLSYMP
jgi:hypothetical protein